MEMNTAVTTNGVQESGLMKVITGPTMQRMMAQSMPRALGLTTEMLTRVIATEFRRIPGLAKCTPASFYRSVMQCSELAMVPGSTGGLCWILPYGKEATFVLGYQGCVELSWRSDRIETIGAVTVYRDEVFEVQLGTDPRIHHVPGEWSADREVRGYYATLLPKGSQRAMFHYMSLEEILAFKEQYVRAKTGPWANAPGTNEFDWMAKKTVFKQVWKLGPKSASILSAFNADDRSYQGLPPEIDITDEATLIEKLQTEGDEVNASGGFGANGAEEDAAEPQPSRKKAAKRKGSATKSEGGPATGDTKKLKYASWQPGLGGAECDTPIEGGCHREKGHAGECETLDGHLETFE